MFIEGFHYGHCATFAPMPRVADETREEIAEVLIGSGVYKPVAAHAISRIGQKHQKYRVGIGFGVLRYQIHKLTGNSEFTGRVNALRPRHYTGRGIRDDGFFGLFFHRSAAFLGKVFYCGIIGSDVVHVLKPIGLLGLVPS